MSLVIDANLVISIVLPLPYSEATKDKMLSWKQFGEVLLAPALWEYEVTSALRRGVFNGLLNAGQAASALSQLMLLNVHSILPSETLNLQALGWAERLGQTRAYDAQYLALAEQAGVELWTADQRLANRAKQAGVVWVHWVGE